MAKRNIIDQDIPSLDIPWDNGTDAYSGRAVEKLLKDELKGKFGAIHFDDSEDAFLTVRTFRSEADKQEWLTDRSLTDLIVGAQTFNVASRHGEGTAFVVKLIGQNTAEPKFCNKKRLPIPLQFTCTKATTVAGTTTTEDMAGTSGRIVVTGRRANTSGNFTPIQPLDGEQRYLDAVANDSGVYRDFDLGPYLQDGEWNYRITVIEPEKDTASTAVNINVTLSESMELVYAGELSSVFSGESITLPFYVKGSVERDVHIEILSADGRQVLATPESSRFNPTQGGSETVQNISVTREQYRFVHGAYRIHAWLTFSNDTNGTKISEQTFGIMYKEDDNDTVLVAVADAITEGDNYDTVTLLNYAIYNPANEPYQLDLKVVDGADGEKSYYSDTVMAENGVVYPFHTVLNCDRESLGDFYVQVSINHGLTSHYVGAVLLTNDIDFSARGTANIELVPNTKTFHGTDMRGNSFVFDPETLRLVDQPVGNLTKILNPSVEGFVRENEVDRFRLLKGSFLDLPVEVITTLTGLKDNTSSTDWSMTMEFDVMISKIVDEKAPVISCFSPTGTSFVGLKVLPNRIMVLGRGSGAISNPDQADYYLEEGCRMHIVVNIVNNLRNEHLNYMRIFVDGVMQREYTYPDTAESPFCSSSGSNGHLLIGSTGCNIDIFGMRIMLNQSMSSTDIQQDYKASMSSIADKKAFVNANDNIVSGGVIDYYKAKEIYNTILYEIPNTTTFPTFNNDTAGDDGIPNCRMTVIIIGDEKHSGVFNSVTIKRQGSTAKTYYWPNISSSNCKADAERGIVKGTFTSFGIDPNTERPYYDKTSYYQLDDSQPKSKKWVGKSNYASAMQSHKQGATAAFNDLHRRCALPAGGFTYDRQHPSTPSRRAVLEKPFLCFYTDKNHPTPTFCGFETWGAAKGDKPTFGMGDDSTSEDYTPFYVMVEGADNNVPGANFETPWIPGEMDYDIDEESFCYQGAPNFDFDMGAKDDDDAPTAGSKQSINDYIIPAFNMVFMLNPNLRPFNGNLAALNQAYLRDKAKENDDPTKELEANVHYWCADTTKVGEYLNVYRLDYITDTWVNAGVSRLSSVHSTGYNNYSVVPLNLKTQLGFADSEILGMNNVEKNQFFIERRVELFKSPNYFPRYFDVSDALFHQCFIKLFAGTDNRAKNTYYWIEGNIDKKIRFAGDDLDTILKTDNKGQQSKPYWILENDRYNEDDEKSYYWNGYHNGLFRLIEMAYADDMRTMMNKIFTAMVQISGSCEQFFQDYFFLTQEYLPAVAYNETARINYEEAQLFYEGIHPSAPNKSYGYKEVPITQSLGNQLHAEREYVTKRLALIQSYANFGDFALNGSDGITFTSTSSSTYNIQYTAFQDIFPVARFGEVLDYGYDSLGVRHTKPWRLKAGETCTFRTTMSGETTIIIHGMSYCASIDNLGANAISGQLRLTGKRLRKLTLPRTSSLFRPANIAFASNMNLEEIDMRNIDFSSAGQAVTFDFNSHMNLGKLDMSGCIGISDIGIPHTQSLATLRLPAGLSRIDLRNLNNLRNFSIDEGGTASLEHVYVDQAGAPGVDTLTLVNDLMANAGQLKSLSIHNVDWLNLKVNTLLWLADFPAYRHGTQQERYSLTGCATIDQTMQRLNWAVKKKLIAAFGNIDAPRNSGAPLSLTYDKVQASSAILGGLSYVRQPMQTEYAFAVTPATANNINIITEPDGRVHEDVKFSFVDSEGNDLDLSQYCNWEDAARGILNVTRITTEAAGLRYTLRCKIGTNVGNTIRYVTADMLVGFYLRTPKIGDYAYADGTFDDQYQKDKTVVGLVFKINPIYKGPDDAEPIIYGAYDNPTEQVKMTKTLVGYQVLIDAVDDVRFKSTDNFINTNSERWGLYNDNGGGNGFSTTLAGKITSASGISSIFDLVGIDNITARGLSGGTNNDYLTTGNYYDDNQEDGFKDYSSVGGCVTDWQGKEKTRQIVRHMETIFNGYLLDADNEDVNMIWKDDDQVSHQLVALPETVEELANAMEILQKANNNIANYRQFLYPAGYGCYLYEPNIKEGETLDPQYARHNWYLPACGELYRLYSFFAKSRTGGIGATYQVGQGTSPAKSVIDNLILQAWESPDANYINRYVTRAHIENSQYDNNEMAAINQYFHSLMESDKPIYAMAIWRAVVAAGASPFVQHTTGYRWSSAEANGGSSWSVSFSYGGSNYYYNKYGTDVVRPAVAYRFNL